MTLAELCETALNRVGKLESEPYFSKESVQQDAGTLQNQIIQFCAIQREATRASGGTGSSSALRLASLAGAATAIANCRGLISPLTSAIAALEPVADSLRDLAQGDQCLSSCLDRIAALRELLELYLRWLESPQSAQYEATPRRIRELSARSLRGERSRLAGLPADIQKCLVARQKSGINPVQPTPLLKSVKSWQKVLGAASALVMIAVVLMLVLVIPRPTPVQEWALRGVLALGGGAFAMVLGGFVDFDATWKNVTLRAGGGFAVVLILYWTNPPALFR